MHGDNVIDERVQELDASSEGFQVFSLPLDNYVAVWNRWNSSSQPGQEVAVKSNILVEEVPRWVRKTWVLGGLDGVSDIMAVGGCRRDFFHGGGCC
ncbi:hypothetical protein SLE2022_226540 [Rubroshorea leprosula]